jgi:hypothetical protein
VTAAFGQPGDADEGTLRALELTDDEPIRRSCRTHDPAPSKFLGAAHCSFDIRHTNVEDGKTLWPWPTPIPPGMPVPSVDITWFTKPQLPGADTAFANGKGTSNCQPNIRQILPPARPRSTRRGVSRCAVSRPPVAAPKRH